MLSPTEHKYFETFFSSFLQIFLKDPPSEGKFYLTTFRQMNYSNSNFDSNNGSTNSRQPYLYFKKQEMFVCLLFTSFFPYVGILQIQEIHSLYFLWRKETSKYVSHNLNFFYFLRRIIDGDGLGPILSDFYSSLI